MVVETLVDHVLGGTGHVPVLTLVAHHVVKASVGVVVVGLDQESANALRANTQGLDLS